jgi:DNA-binding MarR family transcriptional regulator
MQINAEERLGYWMHRIVISLKGHLDTSVPKVGIRGPDAMIILRLGFHGSSTLAELSKMIGHAHTSILRNIDNLEEQGYLIRTPHPQDRRVKIVSLTDKGKEIVPQIYEIITNIHNQALKGFSEVEKEELFTSFRKIHENLINMETDKKEEGTRK